MKNYTYVIFYKPYGVLCQFTGEKNDRTLAEFGLPKNIYAVGRLDKDSEGLLLLTDDGVLNQKIANPKADKTKTYWVQVEKIPSQQSLDQMRSGLQIQNYQTKPCEVRLISEPTLPPRDPPIRFRKTVPTCWLEIKLKEGKNRQVRRMTAKIGHPTLRLIRQGIGQLDLSELSPGEWKKIDKPKI
ncbi:MAG: pseudouridine synthase [Halobacteriovoraceae bacterium]|nr:pseudouridine synthase [Halobacteriovoraceae bacterium]|tara:strand:- start:1663 stop:2217 length:555 start_codon:yes stop_codon:yes gene_type:complete